MIRIAVDTTSTFVDVRFRSTQWMQLLTLCNSGDVEVLIPEVVLQETARHWGVQAEKLVASVNGRINALRNARARLAQVDGVDFSGVQFSDFVTGSPDVAAYLKRTQDELKILGVNVCAVPAEVTIDAVLSRDLQRRKPFSESGKGFRDTLVWETIKPFAQSLQSSDVMFFVTGNSSDYCGEDGAFSPELLGELTTMMGSLERVATLDDLLKNDVMRGGVSRLAQSDEQLAGFLDLTIGEYDPEVLPSPIDAIVLDEVLGAIDRMTDQEVETGSGSSGDVDFADLDIPRELESVTVDMIQAAEASLTWQTYETYQDTTLLIQAEIRAEISLVGFVFKSDAYHLVDAGDIQVLEWDWNDHYARAATSIQARLTFQVRLQRGSDMADNCEFEEARRV